MAINLGNLGSLMAAPKKTNMSRGEGTPFNKAQYNDAIGQQDRRNTLESQRKKFGNAIFNNANAIYNAPLSAGISQPAKPSMTGKTQKQYEDEMARYKQASAGNEIRAKQQAAEEEKGREEDKSKYESAMGELKKLANPKPQYIYDNVLDVFNPWDEEGNTKAPGPHMSNIAFVQKAIDENTGKELAKQYNADLKTADTSNAVEDEAGNIVDADTGLVIASDHEGPWTLAGAELANDDYAGRAAAEYLYNNEALRDKYGDDWSAFQRNGTYDEWRAALEDQAMAQYFTDITNDRDFWTDGAFDFDKYWRHAILLDTMDTPNLSDRDFKLVYGNSAGVLNANDIYRAQQMQANPDRYGLAVDTSADYPTEYADYFKTLSEGENAPLYYDENGNMFYGGFGDNGLSQDQLVSLLNMQALQDSALTYNIPDAYSLDEMNMLSNNPGWNTIYANSAVDDSYSNNFGMPENFDLNNYNPYMLNPNQLYYMLNGEGQAYDPAGYVMNTYMPGLYYTRNM